MTPTELQNAIETGDSTQINQVFSGLGPSAFFAIKGKFGRGPMHWAAKLGSAKLLESLIKNGGDVNALDQDGTTPLMVAAMNDRVEAVQALINGGAGLNLKNRGGRTAYMFAVGAGKQRSADALVGNGADAEAKDAQNKNAVQLAEETAALAAQSAARQLERRVELDIGPLTLTPAARGPLEMDVGAGPEASAPAAGAAPEVDQSPLPPMIAALSEAKQDAYRKLLALGLEDLTAQAERDPYAGRELEAQKICAMIAKEQNPLMIGASGVGKTATAMIVAERLGKEGKLLMQVPSSLLRGNKYAGSVNENIQKWLPYALALRPELAVFIDKTEVLSTGKTSSDNNDTPMQVLKEYLDNTGSKRLILVGAVSEKDAEQLSEDEGFKSLMTPYHINPMSLDQTREALKAKSTRDRLEKSGYEMDKPEAYDSLVDQCLPLLDSFIFNQSFPKKAFDFVAHAMRDTPSSQLSHDHIEESFAKFYSIPMELVKGEIAEESVYATLAERLNERLMGQEEPIKKLSGAVVGGVLLNGAGTRKPTSFMMLGSTGVGKTATAEALAELLGLPMLAINMGEYKNTSQVTELMEVVSTFLTKNYSGVLLFDEIEKGNPQTLDMLLSLLDKGSIGAGAGKVNCGAQIVIGTTNIGAADTTTIKKALAKEYGTMEIDEDWLRSRLIKEGLRPELVNRFTKMLDYNFITPEVALVIGEKMFAAKAGALKSSKGIELNFAPGFIKHQIVSDFDDRFGARGVQRVVDETFERLIEKKEVMLKMRRGTVIEVSDSPAQLRLKITDKLGQQSDFEIPNEKSNPKDQLAAVFASMKKLSEAAELRAMGPACAEAESGVKASVAKAQT